MTPGLHEALRKAETLSQLMGSKASSKPQNVLSKLGKVYGFWVKALVFRAWRFRFKLKAFWVSGLSLGVLC